MLTPKSTLLLLSGGIDSSACLHYYLNKGFSVSALFIHYGQISASKEESAATNISKHYNIPIEKIKLTGFKKWAGGYIPGRNAFLLHTALMAFKENTGIISIGIHAGTNYNDCSERFIATMQSSFDIYTDGCIRIGVPFMKWDKRMIWDYCKLNQVPLEITYSCELGQEQPCGQCLSCKDLEALRVG
ncbi:7-cyano-7-deazaguanine synthase [Anabaena azotica]|uniref:7-cyano-7-deazaguanine synthase n=1 Tax=Anabaena azotica FACHB-119 TaxID=947527 RepID=A0ABR8D3Z4_9NOST|nr:7-cyano-7-deazaguanine synthase [Anabaena azotica]MBD2501887.1 7-cyano-7-deazaguanine synthase [Anabaena azotica FACHB-119]